jgi:hypothetical protein
LKKQWKTKVTLRAFLVIEGAFDSTSHSIIIEAAKRHGLEDMMCRWINFMLGKRKIIATLAGETLEETVTKGCPQGGRFVAPAVESGCG